MKPLVPIVIDQLRQQARAGIPLSQSLRLACSSFDKLDVIQHVRSAFTLNVRQVSPLAGWQALEGDLSDSQLDALLMPEIEHNRGAWDAGAARSSA
ncbi:MAG: hypothetical protein K2R98_31275 [Gemmataceae bacterium]|nr:hypothetical protein [Gemmataceae bacterium]